MYSTIVLVMKRTARVDATTTTSDMDYIASPWLSNLHSTSPISTWWAHLSWAHHQITFFDTMQLLSSLDADLRLLNVVG